MIISRTPFRISFVGGGTDLPSFYKKEVGEVLSTTINKYMYVSVNKRFDNTFRLSYSKLEFAKTRKQIKHDLVKASLQLLNIDKGKDFGMEITSTADVHARGTGLGSSSTFTVGLLNALHYYQDKSMIGPKILADESCKVEIDLCKKPIGKQDQYASAFGGLNRIKFYPDGDVSINPVRCSEGVKQELERNLMLFYTAMDRKADTILEKQKKITQGAKFKILLKMKDLVEDAENALIYGDLNKFGETLHKNWMLKKQLVSTISNSKIDELYGKAIKAGAIGGKVAGAGGGGFMIIYAEPRKQPAIRKTLNLREMQFKFENTGSKIIYGGEK